MNETTTAVTDRRQRYPYPVTARPKDRIVFCTRAEAAEIADVTVRTITRWAKLGYLTKFRDDRGRIRFSTHQVTLMNRFEPETG